VIISINPGLGLSNFQKTIGKVRRNRKFLWTP